MNNYNLTLQPHHYTAQAKIKPISLKLIYEMLPISQMHHQQAVLFFTLNKTFFKITAQGFITLLGSSTITQVRKNFIFIQQLLQKIDETCKINSFSVFQSFISGTFGVSVDLLKFAEICGAEFEIENRFGAKYTKIADGKRFIITVQANGSFIILGCRSTEEAEEGLMKLMELGVDQSFYGFKEVDTDKID